MTVASMPRLSAVEAIERYGKCLELVPIDPHFHDISVGLYSKEGVATVWTFSRREGVEGRIEQVRDQLAKLGDMDAGRGDAQPAEAALRHDSPATPQVPDDAGR